MPAFGDHHRATAATTNPFEDSVPRIQEYTAKEIATLQSRLEKQLGPEYISSRQGPGGTKLYYLAADKVINLANEVFGFNGWSSQIQNVQIDFVDENQTTGKISLGLSIIVRVTLRDGTFHEDIGYGTIENCKGKAAAFEKAKKEGATDALKRALRTFGNVLGNCVYDKDYVSKITKVKVQPSKWDSDNLHRHPDFVPLKSATPTEHDTRNPPGGLDPAKSLAVPRATEHEDDFGGNLFEEIETSPGHSDEVALADNRPQSPKSLSSRAVSELVTEPQPQARPAVLPRQFSAGTSASVHISGPAQARATAPVQAQAQPAQTFDLGTANNNGAPVQGHPTLPQPQPQNASLSTPPTHAPALNPQQHTSNPTTAQKRPQTAQSLFTDQQPQSHALQPPPQKPGVQPQGPQQPQPRVHEPPVGFITSRAAEMLHSDHPPDPNVLNALPRFNPNADSPSMRRTTGVDHAKSAPISRAALASGASAPISAVPAQPHIGAALPQRDPVNATNPSEIMRRQIGAPGGAMSPLSNRNAYKPPTMNSKRPLNGQLDGTDAVSRQPLADVSNTVGQADTADVKRQRVAEN